MLSLRREIQVARTTLFHLQPDKPMRNLLRMAERSEAIRSQVHAKVRLLSFK